jgi:hypothetical protein
MTGLPATRRVDYARRRARPTHCPSHAHSHACASPPPTPNSPPSPPHTHRHACMCVRPVVVVACGRAQGHDRTSGVLLSMRRTSASCISATTLPLDGRANTSACSVIKSSASACCDFCRGHTHRHTYAHTEGVGEWGVRSGEKARAQAWSTRRASQGRTHKVRTAVPQARRRGGGSFAARLCNYGYPSIAVDALLERVCWSAGICILCVRLCLSMCECVCVSVCLCALKPRGRQRCV